MKPPNDHDAIIKRPVAEIAKPLVANRHPHAKPLVDEMVESQAAFWKMTYSISTGVLTDENSLDD